MGISNLSTGLRPGVCTSTTRPSTPFEGQMIYETDTNRVLVYEGASWVMIADTDTPPGFDFISTTSFSSSSSVVVDGCFSSTYDNYKVLFSGYSASGLVSVSLQYRVGGGNATGSDYYNRGWYNFGTLTGYAPAAQVSWYLVDVSSTSTSPGTFVADILNPNLAVRTTGTATGMEPANYYAYNFTNTHAVATAYTGFRLIPSSSTITGTVTVFGYRK